MADERPSRQPDLAHLLRRAGWLKPLARRLARLAVDPRGAARDARAHEGSELEEDSVLDEARAARCLAAEVLALEEPARSVLLLRYLRGAGLPRIARALRVDEATARARLHEALALLDGRLRARHGSREAWLEALRPLRAP
jgi:DNA-directed RNA polymerase specialized sigma24 family protein